MEELTAHRTVDAPTPIVWDVITDHELYAEAAPNLASVEVLDGEGNEFVRRCIDTDGNAWTESCTRWEEGELFAVAVDVESSEFHRWLFTKFDGEWALQEDANDVTITIRLTYEPRYGPLGKLISWYFSLRGPPIIESLLDNWVAAIDDRLEDSPSDHDVATAHLEGETNALYR